MGPAYAGFEAHVPAVDSWMSDSSKWARRTLPRSFADLVCIICCAAVIRYLQHIPILALPRIRDKSFRGSGQEIGWLIKERKNLNMLEALRELGGGMQAAIGKSSRQVVLFAERGQKEGLVSTSGATRG